MKKNAFTVAETLIVLVVVAVLAVLFIAIINSNDVKQKEIVIRYQKAYADLATIAQAVSQDNTYRKPLDTSIAGGFDYLSCSGMDSSDCLKSVILKNSKAQDCIGNACMKNFTEETLPAIKSVDGLFTNLSDFKMVTLPSGAVVAMKYFDKTCNLNMPVYKKGGVLQTIANSCGLLVVDVNGKEKPNKYNADGTDSDIFLFALQKDGIKGSDQAIAGAAGCKNGGAVDFATGGCIRDVNCPAGSDPVEAGTVGAFQYKDMWGNYGWCGAACPDGQDLVGSVCLPGCPDGETRTNGVCLPDDCSQESHQIKNQATLEAIPDGASGAYCLMADIDLQYNDTTRAKATTGWVPINNFSGKLYGYGHKINNFFIYRKTISPGLAYLGLFSKTLTGALIDDVHIRGGANFTDFDGRPYCIATEVDAGMYQGSLVGQATGTTINNCSNTCSIYANRGWVLGGLIGNSVDTINITNSFNTGNIYGYKVVASGGLSGTIHSGNVTNSYNTGAIEISQAGSSDIGGLVGSGGPIITNSYNEGNITVNGLTSSISIGGLLGSGSGAYYYPTIASSYNKGALYVSGQGQVFAAGLGNGLYGADAVFRSYNTGNIEARTTGAQGTSHMSAAGLSGDSYHSDIGIKQSYNTGTVYANSTYDGVEVAGLTVTTNTSIENSYNRASVTALTSYYVEAGGLVLSSPSVKYSYNSGNIIVSGASPLSGGINRNGLTYTGVFYQSGTAPTCNAYRADSGITGCSSKASGDFTSGASFSGWDTSIWKFASGSYPGLQDSIMPPRTDVDGSAWDSSILGSEIWEWNTSKSPARPTLIDNPEP